jgi:HAD superfamily hydrolase (TIGR01509 family)
MAIKGLIFDFDGLIIDTEQAIFKTWAEIYQSHGCQLSITDWLTTIGTTHAAFDPAIELGRQLGHALDWATIEPLRQERERELIDQLALLPGVAEMLRDARRLGLKVGLASSSTCAWVTGHLTRTGLIEYFDCIIASDDVQRTKPDPALFLMALESLHLLPEQTIAFEDSDHGLLAARSAGIYAVAVPGAMTRSLPFEHADLRLESLAVLPLETLLEMVDQSRSEDPPDMGVLSGR